MIFIKYTLGKITIAFRMKIFYALDAKETQQDLEKMIKRTTKILELSLSMICVWLSGLFKWKIGNRTCEKKAFTNHFIV